MSNSNQSRLLAGIIKSNIVRFFTEKVLPDDSAFVRVLFRNSMYLGIKTPVRCYQCLTGMSCGYKYPSNKCIYNVPHVFEFVKKNSSYHLMDFEHQFGSGLGQGAETAKIRKSDTAQITAKQRT